MISLTRMIARLGALSGRRFDGAVQWWKNGDHPSDNVGELLDDSFDDAPYRRQEGAVIRYFRHPDFHADQHCPQGCGHVLHDHGWIDAGTEGRTVCPGDWVLTLDGEYFPIKPDAYTALSGRDSRRELPRG